MLAAVAVAVAATAFTAAESLVVLHGVGVLLLSERGVWWWRGGHTRQFLDIADIHSVIIHEVCINVGVMKGGPLCCEGRRVGREPTHECVRDLVREGGTTVKGGSGMKPMHILFWIKLTVSLMIHSITVLWFRFKSGEVLNPGLIYSVVSCFTAGSRCPLTKPMLLSQFPLLLLLLCAESDHHQHPHTPCLHLTQQ
jgi:hypothetical protein